MIRPYQPKDTDQILDAWHQASLLAHPFLTADFLAQERSNIRDLFLPNAQTFVAEADGTVIGFISLAGNEVGGLFVHPAWHKKGLGKALMDQASSLHPVLELEVFKDNSLGRAFYERYGFVLVEEVSDEATGLPALRLRFERL